MKRWKLAAAKSPRVLGVLLSLTIALGSTFGSASAALAAEVPQTEMTKLEETAENAAASHASESGKRETVYVMGDAKGDTRKIIVSEWLRNKEGAAALTDRSDLSDIENVEGYETYTKNADGTLTWQADGSDIYYQGTTDKKLPVGVRISYTLDGKAISPEELAGKSGRVTIRFDYTNDAEKKILVNGREETVKVPFAMISGCILPADHFSNVEVTNGRVTSEGSNSIVLGLAFPGLKESLDLASVSAGLSDADASSKVTGLEEDIPEYVEITADCTNFELGMTMTLADSDLLSRLDLGDLDLGGVRDDMDRLEDGADQLVEGAEALKDGTGKLAGGAGALSDGAGTLAGGASALSEGAGRAADGAAALKDGARQVSDGAAALKEGMGELAGGADALTGGAAVLAGSVSAQLVPGTRALTGGAADLLAGSGRLGESAHTFADNMDGLSGGLSDLEAGLTKVDRGIDSLAGGTAALLAEDGIPALAKGAGDVADGVSQVDGAVQNMQKLLSGVGDLPTLTAQTAGAAALLKDVDPKTLQADAQALSEAAGKLQALQGRMDDRYQTLLSEEEAASAAADEAVRTRDAARKDLEDAAAALKNVHSRGGAEEPAKPSADAVYAALNGLSAEVTEGGEEGEASASVKGKEAALSALDAYAEQVAQYQKDMEAYAASREPADLSGAQAAYDEAYAAYLSAADACEKKLADAAKKKGLAEAFKEAKDMASINADAYTKAAADLSGLFSTLSTLKENLTAIQSGLENLGSFATVVGTVQGLSAKTPAIAAGADKVHKSLEALYAVNPKDPSASGPLVLLNAGASSLDAGMAKVMEGAESASSGAGTLAAYSHAIADGVDSLTDGAGKVKTGAAALEEGVGTLNEGAGKLLAGARAAKDGVSKLDAGAGTLAGGAAAAADGAAGLSDGITALSDGASRLADGSSALAEGVGDLAKGAEDLDEGTGRLLDGLLEYRDEGISRLTDLFGDDLTGLLDRMKGLREAGASYTSYGGAMEDTGNTVRFVFKTDAVSSDD